MNLTKYLTDLKLSNIQSICKEYNINYKYHVNKISLLLLLNKYLLNKLTKKQLILLSNYNKIKINIHKTKIYIINQIYTYIKKFKKFNIVSIYYYSFISFSNKRKISYKNLPKSNNINTYNNETFGITCEYALCKLYKLNCNLQHRINLTDLTKLITIFKLLQSEFTLKHKLTITEFSGYNNDKIDFILTNIISKKKFSLSVKSNINSKYLLCPQTIGQCTIKSFIKFIQSNKFFQNIKIKSLYSIKKFIIQNISKLILLYIDHLFCCDYLLWIIKDKNNIKYTIFQKNNFKNIKLNRKYFKFTKNLKSWNESNTIKYKNISLGIFQIHNNRNCIKFRFYFNNLLKILLNLHDFKII